MYIKSIESFKENHCLLSRLTAAWAGLIMVKVWMVNSLSFNPKGTCFGTKAAR